MSIRTIEAPGVEIKEIDKSAYAPAMTGTRCFVMGYSDKGEPYQPMQFTSKSAWQSYYGDPDNEAERYFYNACTEVINQNGVLYSSRIPYDNAAKDKIIGYKFKVQNTPKNIPTAGEYLLNYPVRHWVDHDSDFERDALKYMFDNKLNREIDPALSGLEFDSELQQFYNAAIEKFANTTDLDTYGRSSIEYYHANVSASLELSARFLTRDEAVSYLEDFNNLSKKGCWYYLTNPLSCIRYDAGDWIAQPIYCDFVKEAVMLSVSQYDIETIGQLADVVKGYIPGDYISSDPCTEEEIYIPPYVAMKSVKDILNNLSVLNKDIDQMDPEDRNQITELIAFTNYIAGNFDSKQEIHTLDSSLNAYLFQRIKTIQEERIEVPVIDVYENLHDGGIEPFDLPANYDISAYDDGYDNEFLWNNTVSTIYDFLDFEHDDEDMSIARLVKGNKSDPELSSKPELWQYALNRSLSALVRDRYSSGDNDRPYASWADMLSCYKNSGEITFSKIISDYGVTQERVSEDVPYWSIVDSDQTLDRYIQIDNTLMPITCDLTAVDEYRTGEDKVDAQTFWVFDKTCATLNSIPEDSRKDEKRQLIGIFPVITTAANALYAQSLITVPDSDVPKYETVTGTITKSPSDDTKNDPGYSLLSTDISKQFSNVIRDTVNDTAVWETVSRDANGYFLPIQMKPDLSGFDTENLKKIGVVVVKAYLDASEGNKVSFNVVESFCGSLDKDAKNPNTGVSTFIDKIVNTQSDYIYFFSNCFVNTAQKKNLSTADLFIAAPGTTGMLGWFEKETVETISLTSLYQGIDSCFKNVENINERDIDIVCDAGLANIAQYMKSIYGGSGAHAYDLQATDEAGNPLMKLWKCNSSDCVGAWKTVLFKYDNFCKNTRHDCMFIADGPRPLVLQGDKKIVRPSKPSNTIDANILPYVKWMSGLNTNYGAGYCNWFQVTDDFTGDEFWLPPSIKAMGVYIYTDLNFEYWDAPAGMNRGVIQALDCAFSPTLKQAGPIYNKNWNYAINYPNEGIVLEGQKTFQVKPSAFDRVNVRRLFLRLERQAYKIAKYFVYEGNTAYTRQRLVDMLTPMFNQAKVGGGIYDYKIICDESTNTADVIDRKELRMKIGIKPVKTAEFILIDFIALSTGGSFSEM